MSEVVNVWGGECLGGERLTIVDFAKAFIANLFACLAVCQVIYNHDVNVKPDTESGPLVSGFRGGLV